MKRPSLDINQPTINQSVVIDYTTKHISKYATYEHNLWSCNKMLILKIDYH